MNRKLIIEYGGCEFSSAISAPTRSPKQLIESMKPRVLGVEFCNDDNLLFTVDHINGAKLKMNITSRFFNVYEFGPQVYDVHTLDLLRKDQEKQKRYQEYLKLKEEFDN